MFATHFLTTMLQIEMLLFIKLDVPMDVCGPYGGLKIMLANLANHQAFAKSAFLLQ